MTTRRDIPALDEIRRIAAQVQVEPYEWLPASLRRIGSTFGASTFEVLEWCGLARAATSSAGMLSTFLNDDIAERLHAGLGIDPDSLPTTVMSYLPEDLVAVRINGTVAQSKNWTRGSGTRYCPQCLVEHPGVFYTYWRLWWCFLCERHNAVLRDVCPACHCEYVETRLAERQVRDPGLCWSERGEDGPCLHPLSRSWTEPAIESSSPLMHAQQTLSRTWMPAAPLAVDVHASTLRGAAIALLGAGDITRIADLAQVDAGDLEGLFDVGSRIGTTPPMDAFAMGALLGAAYQIVTDDESVVAPIIRHVTYERSSRTDQYAAAPWSARNFIGTWPGIDQRFRRRILRALDADLTPIQRLVHGSVASAGSSESYADILDAAVGEPQLPGALTALMNAPEAPTSTSWRFTAVPDLLWTSWAAPLGIDDHTDGVALQSALSDAVRIAGTGAFPDYEAIAGIGRRLRTAMLGTSAQTTSILRQICELAIALRASPGPIDYRARRGLEFATLLAEDDWRDVCESAGEDPGRHRRLLNARRYALMRMTGRASAALPEQIAMHRSLADAAEYTAFALSMSAELKVSIDAYLAGWLARVEKPANGVRIPVTWEPPRFVHDGASLGRELNDIDIATIHALLDDGETTISRLALAVQRSSRHVRWAITEYPPATGRATQTIDWETRLKSLPNTYRFTEMGRTYRRRRAR